MSYFVYTITVDLYLNGFFLPFGIFFSFLGNSNSVDSKVQYTLKKAKGL